MSKREPSRWDQETQCMRWGFRWTSFWEEPPVFGPFSQLPPQSHQPPSLSPSIKLVPLKQRLSSFHLPPSHLHREGFFRTCLLGIEICSSPVGLRLTSLRGFLEDLPLSPCSHPQIYVYPTAKVPHPFHQAPSIVSNFHFGSDFLPPASRTT